MNGLWATLAPLIIGSAIVPIQIVVTILLLRSSAGRRTAFAWVGGMTVVRLIQGVLFGLVLGVGPTATPNSPNAVGPVLSTLLLVLGILFFAMAARQVFMRDDPDAPPPSWMKQTETMTPAKAFLLGGGMMVIGVKFWVFTLSAVGAITDAELSRTTSIVVFASFVVLAQGVHFGALAMATIAPDRSGVALDSMATWLQDKNRVIVIVLGVVFGSWFVIKALRAFGIL